MSPDDDPWAQPLPKPGSVRQQPESAGRSVASESSEHHRKQVAVPDLSDDTDPWAQPARPAASEAPSAMSSADLWNTAADPWNTADDPWKDVPPPTEPDDPWNAGGTGGAENRFPVTPQSASQSVSQHAPQSAPQSRANDPWNMPAQSAPSSKPQVDADEDEYSMDDESLGSAVAMSRDELRKLFEVKNVETFAADDPRNPRNMHVAAKHDD